MNFDVVTEFVAGLIFCEADGTDRRMREDDGRYVLVFEAPVCHATVEPVREPASGRDCNRCERGAARYVAEREDVIDTGLLPFVRRYETALVRFDTGSLEIQ